MNHDDRRIRSLKLRSPDETLALQARYRLEEAFRIASFPGLPPNAQLLVRRFDLGSFRADRAPVLLAGRISELMRNLAAAAVCVDDRSAAHANVVWFSDPLQPYKVLLLRLLDGNGLQEWYWRTLFPNQALKLNSATIESILSRAATTPLRGMAPARLLQETLEPRRFARLLPCITAELARRLLHERGLSPVAVANPAAQTEGTMEPSNAGAMQHVMARTMSLPWRQAIKQAVRCWGEQDVRTLWFAWHALIIHQPAWLERRDALQRIVPGVWLESWELNKSSAAARKETASVDAASDEVVAGLKTEFSLTQQPEAASFTTETVTKADSNAELLAQDASPAETALDRGEIKVPGTDSPQGVVAPFSAHAGFGFVVSLLQRLGMAELLACNGRLVALDLARQLLWFLARRFGMAESDPSRLLFVGFEAGEDTLIEQFQAPDGWRRLVTPSGRPLNALGPAEKDNTVRLPRLIKVLYLIASLYLHRYCGLSLRTLIHRPGRVVLTATHWDVIFDLNQIDLRLRRVALDSDPGWVAWLGRVVQFHYDSEEARYVQSGRDLGRR